MTPSPYPRNNFNTELIQSCMNGEHFSLLIEISPIRSKKNIMALKEYLVDGYSKQESCERNNGSKRFTTIYPASSVGSMNRAIMLSEPCFLITTPVFD